MTNLKSLADPFQFQEQDVRTLVDDDGHVWFLAKDICKSLDIPWSSRVIQPTPKQWLKSVDHSDHSNKSRLIFINEPGLYQLVFRYKKANSIVFCNWVWSDVVTKIRGQLFKVA